MCEKCVSDNFQTIVERLGSAGSFLVLTHARPDGDGLGTMAALVSAGRAAGKTVRMLLPGNVPARYEFLFPDAKPAGADEFAKLADGSDLIVIVDTCAFAQLDGLADGLRARRDKIIVIDHHATADDIGSVQWIDSSAAAAGVMAEEVIEALDWSVDEAAAEALFSAVASDTGWFRFSNTDPRTMKSAAKLIERGAKPNAIYNRIYQSDRPERLRLLQRTLAGMELLCQDRLAVMAIRKSDFDATGARGDETENFVNESLRIGAVEVAVLLVEEPDCVRVSLRSRSQIDVSAIAACFGGGGHARAAGLRTTENLDTAKQQLIAACTEKLI